MIFNLLRRLHILHTWTKWKPGKSRSRFVYESYGKVKDTETEMHRKCKICAKTDFWADYRRKMAT